MCSFSDEFYKTITGFIEELCRLERPFQIDVGEIEEMHSMIYSDLEWLCRMDPESTDLHDYCISTYKFIKSFRDIFRFAERKTALLLDDIRKKGMNQKVVRKNDHIQRVVIAWEEFKEEVCMLKELKNVIDKYLKGHSLIFSQIMDKRGENIEEFADLVKLISTDDLCKTIASSFYEFAYSLMLIIECYDELTCNADVDTRKR